MIGDVGDDMSQIGIWVDAVELGGFDQTVNGRGALAASV